MPLKTCHNTEAGFLQGGCSAYPPTQRWRHLRLRRSCTWAVWLPLSPQLGDHPPSHDDNFVKCQMILLLTNMASGYAFQFQGMQSSIFRASTQTQKWEDCDWKGIWDKKNTLGCMAGLTLAHLCSCCRPASSYTVRGVSAGYAWLTKSLIRSRIRRAWRKCGLSSSSSSCFFQLFSQVSP